jgi:calcineurin-like phosphoesterase family protein
MNIHTARKTSRRDFLKLSAGTLLALGLAPGCARFRDGGRGGNFSFVVINDAHFYTPKCPEFYARVKQSVLALSPRPELCLFVGDLSDNGSTKELGAMKEILDGFHMPWHAVIGNHDYITQTDRSAYEDVLPKSLNYGFEHRGWRVIALDTTEGKKADKTKIQPHTMAWVKENAPKLDPRQPTILFTHFPMGPTAPKRPLNADELLEPFTKFNLVQVFNGHHHGFTERKLRETIFVTNKCCSISRPNHDKTTEKGYFHCTTKDGKIERKFIEVPVA